MKNSRSNEAISQIIGEIILLAIAVTAVSVITMQVLSTPGPQDKTEVTIIGKIDQGQPVVYLQRGESLGPDTKFFINVANGRFVGTWSLKQFLSDQWKIGEKITLPSGETNIPTYKGPQIEMTVVDTKTNALVFWGILEGSKMPYKGGIWHFNESFWSGIFKDVNDSSGNDNNGTAINKPKIINGIDKNGGYFNRTNYIEVETSWSLNMTDQITVSAWMKPNASSFISYTAALPNTFGFTPYIIHVGDNIYAVVSEDQGSNKCGLLQTVNITSNGEKITRPPYHNESHFGTAPGAGALRPMIINIKEKKLDTPSMVLIAYNTKAQGNWKMELRTYNITTNGSISDTTHYLTLPEEYKNIQNRPSLQKITDTLCAIAYKKNTTGGILKTLTISSNGTITPTNYNYSESNLYEPYFFPIYNNIYGLAYRGVSDKGIIKTFSFNISTGNITYISSWTYSDTAAFEPCVTHVSGNIFAVVYRNNFPQGIVKTFEILPNGSFGPMQQCTWRIFENVLCYDPWIVHDVDDSYSVVYSTNDDNGNNPPDNGTYISFELGKYGSITIKNSGVPFERGDLQGRCYTPIILPINEHIFVITYTGSVEPGQSGHPGRLIAVVYPGMKGIFKGDSYMICSSTDQVEGRINDVRIYYNNSLGTLGPNWHHITLTYNGTNICLYVHRIDGTLIKKVSKNYSNHDINLSKYDLYLGRNYLGFIDEIAIYEKALSDCQINYICQPQHQHKQRMLEYYLLGENCIPS